MPYPSLLAIAGAGLAFLPFAPQDPDRARSRARAVRGAGAARRGVRHLAARSAAQRLADRLAGGDRRRADDRGRRIPGLALRRSADRCGDRARRDRRAAGCGRSHRGTAAARIPQRIGLVLQGESLLNDATALLIYRAAVAAAVGSFSFASDAPILLLVGGRKPRRRLCAGADCICSASRTGARCAKQHRPAVRQHLRRVACCPSA